MYFRLTTLKIPPPNVISPIFVLQFFFALGSTHDSTDCWSAHRSPAARGSFKRTRLKQWPGGNGRPGGIDRVESAECPPPKQQSWLRRCYGVTFGPQFRQLCFQLIASMVWILRLLYLSWWQLCSLFSSHLFSFIPYHASQLKKTLCYGLSGGLTVTRIIQYHRLGLYNVPH